MFYIALTGKANFTNLDSMLRYTFSRVTHFLHDRSSAFKRRPSRQVRRGPVIFFAGANVGNRPARLKIAICGDFRRRISGLVHLPIHARALGRLSAVFCKTQDEDVFHTDIIGNTDNRRFFAKPQLLHRVGESLKIGASRIGEEDFSTRFYV